MHDLNKGGDACMREDNQAMFFSPFAKLLSLDFYGVSENHHDHGHRHSRYMCKKWPTAIKAFFENDEKGSIKEKDFSYACHCKESQLLYVAHGLHTWKPCIIEWWNTYGSIAENHGPNSISDDKHVRPPNGQEHNSNPTVNIPLIMFLPIQWCWLLGILTIFYLHWVAQLSSNMKNRVQLPAICRS